MNLGFHVLYNFREMDACLIFFASFTKHILSRLSDIFSQYAFKKNDFLCKLKFICGGNIRGGERG